MWGSGLPWILSVRINLSGFGTRELLLKDNFLVSFLSFLILLASISKIDSAYSFMRHRDYEELVF